MASLDVFNNMRQAILTKIVSEQTTIQEAYFEQRSSFEGSPAAVIGVSQNEALYHSTGRDKMTFVFQILIYIPMPSDGDDIDNQQHDVEVRLGKAYWEVLRMFRQRDSLGEHADFVEPIPSVWGFEERDGGILRFAEINLRCVTHLSILPDEQEV